MKLLHLGPVGSKDNFIIKESLLRTVEFFQAEMAAEKSVFSWGESLVCMRQVLLSHSQAAAKSTPRHAEGQSLNCSRLRGMSHCPWSQQKGVQLCNVQLCGETEEDN